jgi:hypothetical protein
MSERLPTVEQLVDGIRKYHRRNCSVYNGRGTSTTRWTECGYRDAIWAAAAWTDLLEAMGHKHATIRARMDEALSVVKAEMRPQR